MECEKVKSAQTHKGRSPLLTEDDRALLRESVQREPGVPMAELVRLLAAQGKKVSGTTISKALKEMGFRRAKRAKAKSTPAPQTPPRYQPDLDEITHQTGPREI